MRILIVTSRLPFPPTWGAASRDYQLARHLARRYEVTMLCYAADDERDAVRTLREELEDVHVVPLPTAGTAARRASQLQTLVSPAPFTTSEESSREMQHAIDRLLAGGRFDVVQVESVRMLGMRFPRSTPLVLDEHNIEYELRQRMGQTERSAPRRLFSAVEYRKLRRVEQRWWRTVQACVVTSEREQHIVEAVAPATPCITVPNGVDVDYFTPSAVEPVPDTLVFTGLLSYRPNWEAVHHLIEEIFPLVRLERPSCTLTVVGRGHEPLGHLARPGVTFTGFVPDVRPYLERASVAVVPLRMGGGTRLKVVEAFAMGKAVVSTTLGSEGIDARHSEHLLIGDDPRSFADQVVRLLSEPALGRRLGQAASSLARESYSWSRSATLLGDFHAELLQPVLSTAAEEVQAFRRS